MLETMGTENALPPLSQCYHGLFASIDNLLKGEKCGAGPGSPTYVRGIALPFVLLINGQIEPDVSIRQAHG